MAKSISYTDSGPTIIRVEASDLTAVDTALLSGTIGARLKGTEVIEPLTYLPASLDASNPSAVRFDVEWSYDDTKNGLWEIVAQNLTDTASPPNLQQGVLVLGEITLAVGVTPPTGSDTVPKNAKVIFAGLSALPNNGAGWQRREHAELTFESDGLRVKNIRKDANGNSTPGLISGAIATPIFNTQPGHRIEIEFIAPRGVNQTNAGVGAGLVEFNSIVDFSKAFQLAMNGYTYAPPNPNGGQYDYVTATPTMVEGDEYMVRVEFSADKTEMEMALFNVSGLEFDPQKREGVIWETIIPTPEAMQANTRAGIDPGELPDGIKILSIIY